MSFRQLFDRMNRYTRSHTGGFGRTDREDLRRAEELIEAERRRDEREREERERKAHERKEHERKERERRERELKADEPGRSAPSAGAGITPVLDETTRALYLQSIAVLSVADGASWEEITAAYRKLVTIFHPDRTSRLTPVEREVAHRRTQEINIAYGFLMRYHGKKP